MTSTVARHVGALALLAAALGLGATGCGGSDDSGASDTADSVDTRAASGAPQGALRAGWEGAPDTWAPGTDIGYGYPRVPYETLVERDPKDASKVTPLLATEWEQTKSGLTFKLRPDVTFHDGTPFDAAAVKANLEYVKEQKGPFSAALDPIESVEVVDDLTVELETSGEAPSLLTALSSRAGLMASPKALADGSVEDAPVGTGPWRYDEAGSIPGREWAFSFYDGYWDPASVGVAELTLVAIDDNNARLDALLTGEVDLADVNLLLEDKARSSGVGLEIFPGLQYGTFLFDRGPGGAFEDVETRRAFCQAVDTEAIVKLFGTNFLAATNQRFGEGALGHSGAIPPLAADPPAAKRTLEGKGLDVAMAVYDQNQPSAEAMAGELKKAGVDLKLQPLPAAEYFQTWYSGKYEVGTGDNTELTPYDWYVSWFAEDAPNNPSKRESPELKAAADAAIAAGSGPEAAELWGKVSEQIDAEKLVCNQMNVNQAIGFDEDKVGGVEVIDWEPSNVQYKKLRAK